MSYTHGTSKRPEVFNVIIGSGILIDTQRLAFVVLGMTSLHTALLGMLVYIAKSIPQSAVEVCS